MEPPAENTTRGNLAFFLLGIFVALCIAGIFTLGSRLFFHWQQGPTPLVTGEENLDELIQTDMDLFWTLVPNLKNKQAKAANSTPHKQHGKTKNASACF